MFDLDSKQSTDEHINAFMLAIRKNNMHHEYIFCRLFLYTFEGKATTSYFSQPIKVSRLETAFLENFGDNKTLEVLVMKLSNMNMESKERINDFNVRFLALKNKIPNDLILAKHLVIVYCVK